MSTYQLCGLMKNHCRRMAESRAPHQASVANTGHNELRRQGQIRASGASGSI